MGWWEGREMKPAVGILLWLLCAISAVVAMVAWTEIAFSERVYEPFGFADMVMLAAFTSLLVIAITTGELMARRL
jgi:hypothetical protein